MPADDAPQDRARMRQRLGAVDGGANPEEEGRNPGGAANPRGAANAPAYPGAMPHGRLDDPKPKVTETLSALMTRKPFGGNRIVSVKNWNEFVIDNLS